MASIAFIEVTATVSIGGVQTCVWRLADALAAQGHRITVIGGDGAMRPKISGSVEVWTFPFVHRDRVLNLGSRFRRIVERLSFARTARRRVLAANFDWIVINKPFDFFWAWLVPAQGPTRVAFLSGGTDFFLFDRILSRRLSTWMSVSHFNAWQLHARYKGWPRVIFNGVDPVQFQVAERDDARRKQLGLDANEVVFGFVGRLTGWKGASVAIEAFSQVRTSGRAVRLLIVGDGEQLSRLQEQAQRLQVAGSVVFVPAVAHDEVPRLYRAIDVGVFPSIGDEAFGISLAEAMCCGKPVIASHVGGMPEVLGNEGSSGILVPPHDAGALARAMVQLTDDAAARLLMGRAARKRIITQFTWEQAANRLSEALAVR